MALHRFVFIACLVGLLLPACTQDEDEACQVDTDCADGLVCIIAGSSLRGTCLPPDQEPVDEPDAGGDADASVPRDASVLDSSADDDAG
jgi:hypothetical protein